MYVCMYVYMYIYICIYIYISLYISALHGSGPSRTLLREISGPAGVFVDVGGLFINKTALGSPSGDGSQQAGLNAAIESFWRCEIVEICLFLRCYVRDLGFVMCSG